MTRKMLPSFGGQKAPSNSDKQCIHNTSYVVPTFDNWPVELTSLTTTDQEILALIALDVGPYEVLPNGYR